jgi:hypothetical protein
MPVSLDRTGCFLFLCWALVIVVTGNHAHPHNLSKYQGSMLWSHFSAIFDNFQHKNWRFFSKTNVMINI